MANGLTSAEYMTFNSSYALIITVVSSLTGIMQNFFLTTILSENVRPIFEANYEEDEATSALDNMTQTKVMENIRDMKCSVVMVAHRLSTVENFDRIIMLEDGVIVEEGSFEELMKKSGKFAELVEKQLVEEEKRK